MIARRGVLASSSRNAVDVGSDRHDHAPCAAGSGPGALSPDGAVPAGGQVRDRVVCEPPAVRNARSNLFPTTRQDLS